MAASDFGYGQQRPGDGASRFNAISFIIEQALGRLRTAIVVQVVAVTGGGDAAEPPTVDVTPLVNMLDGNDNSVQHGTIYGLPVMRLQSGTNALIIDPVVDDIGIALILDRDSSGVINSGEAANPGSLRHHDLADGIYLGGIIGDAPKQTIEFTANGIKLKDANGNVLESKADGWHVTGAIICDSDITAGFGGADQVGLRTHKHGGVTTGGGVTLAPTPGT
jgi:hypothetical protein